MHFVRVRVRIRVYVRCIFAVARIWVSVRMFLRGFRLEIGFRLGSVLRLEIGFWLGSVLRLEIRFRLGSVLAMPAPAREGQASLARDASRVVNLHG